MRRTIVLFAIAVVLFIPTPVMAAGVYGENGLQRNWIDNLFWKNLERFEACHAASSDGGQPATGTVKLKFVIDRRRKHPIGVTVAENTTGRDSLGECFAREWSRVRLGQKRRRMPENVWGITIGFSGLGPSPHPFPGRELGQPVYLGYW